MRSVATEPVRPGTRGVGRLAAALVVVLAAAFAVAVGSPPAAAQDDGGGPSTTLVPIEDQRGTGRPSIIPTPSTARGEVRDGEPGSAAQYAVLAMTVAGVATIVLLARRESRRKLAARSVTRE